MEWKNGAFFNGFAGRIYFMKVVKVLDQYYILTRYANAFANGLAKRYFTELQAKQAIEFAEAILNEAEKIVFERRSLSG